MKPLIILFLLIPLNLFSNEAFVEIYKTHDNGMYGRSEDRDIVLSIKESVFKRHESLQVANDYNYLTSVTIDSEIVNKLDEIFTDKTTIQFGFVKITKDGDIYTIEDDNIFLNFSFSFEKPNKEILVMIATHYETNKSVNDVVTEHYKNNYIIKIHTAENLLFPEAKEITYDEVIIMATIIGDSDQWLWGIHNGKDYLRSLLFD